MRSALCDRMSQQRLLAKLASSVTKAVRKTTTGLSTTPQETVAPSNPANILRVEQLPGPIHIPLFGAAASFIISSKKRRQMHLEQVELVKKYGRVFRYDVGPQRSVAIACPDLLEEIYRHEDPIPTRQAPLPWMEYLASKKRPGGLLTSQNEEWKTRRDSVRSLMLKPRSMEGMFTRMMGVSKDLVQFISKHQRHNSLTVPELPHVLYRWSFEGIVSVLFGERAGCLEDETPDKGARFIDSTQEITGACFGSLALFAPLQRKFNTARWLQHNEAWNTVIKSVEYYTENLLRDLDSERAAGTLMTVLLNDDKMSKAQLESMVAELMFGGVDTTSNTLCFALHNLASNPQKQDILRSEILNVLKENREPSFNMLKDMTYLRAVIRETLRMYPVLFINGRTIKEDFVSTSHKLRLCQGDNILFLHYAMGRDEKLFPKSSEFIPERWHRACADQVKVEKAFASIPFGFGTRGCIGKRIAELELSVALIQILQTYSLKVESEWEPITRSVLVPGNECPISFTPL